MNLFFVTSDKVKYQSLRAMGLLFKTCRSASFAKVPIFPLQKWLQHWIRLEVWNWPRLSWPGAVHRESKMESLLFCVVFMPFSEENQQEKPSSTLGMAHPCHAAMPRTLRKVLRNAMRRGILSDNTLMVLQGDLNSRTLLGARGEVKDILQEVMADSQLQARWAKIWVSETAKKKHILFEDSLMSFLL